MADPTRARDAQIEMVTGAMQRDSDRVQSSYQTADVGNDGFVDQNPFSSGPPRRKEKNFFGMNGKSMRFWICLVGLVGCLIFIIAIAAKGAKGNNDDTTVTATVSTVAVTLEVTDSASEEFVPPGNDAGVEETTVTEKSTTAPTTATANDTETTTAVPILTTTVPISNETTVAVAEESTKKAGEEEAVEEPAVEEPPVEKSSVETLEIPKAKRVRGAA